MLAPLPIDAVLPRVVDALARSNRLIVQAPPGAGKTTRVPPALLDANVALGDIVLLEPRRLAARAAARRISQERGRKLGDEVGYQVRFDRCAGPTTRILAVTPGILLRWLQDDPFLSSAGIVVFDEFHERGIDADLALGMLKLVQEGIRPELKLVFMSATMPAQSVAAYLGGCPIVESAGRSFPVEIKYRPRMAPEPWPHAAARAVEDALDQSDGDVLVFLPGMREIRQTERELSSLAASRGLAVLPLHGDLPLERQDAALAPNARRKIVLATNVAETSITIDGIAVVVDTGLARSLLFDADLGLDRLELGPISKASAEQRAGRAGRTRPGLCVRLWSEAWQRNLAERTEPEIRRVDLAGPLLHLLALGESEPAKFPWLDAPPPENVTRSLDLLRRLGAVTGEATLTPTGRIMARLPVHPRLGRLLIEGYRLGHVQRAALTAAILSERDVLMRDRKRSAATRSDVLDRVEALESFAGSADRRGSADIESGTAQFVLRSQQQLAQIGVDEARAAKLEQAANASDRDEAVRRCLLAAFPDRLVRRRQPGERRGLMAGGRGVVLGPGSGVTDGELFLAIDVDARASEAVVHLASRVEREWLTDGLSARTDVFYDADKDKLVARKRLCWDDLVLEESPAALPDDASDELLRAAAAHPDRALPAADSPAGEYLTRLHCLANWMPELGLPVFDRPALAELLPQLIGKRRSLSELRDAPWLDAIKGQLAYAKLQAVEREAPERLQVPSGSRMSLRYEEGRPPVLAVRIQELFGLAQTPRIAGGRVAVLLHLLAPNGRPQQVTDDLASFWKNTYPQVRKDLRGRYPKHAWPEDPLAAPPTRRVKR